MLLSGEPVSDALPPGSELPPARQTTRWMTQPLSFLRDLHARHGDVFTVRLLREEPWVVVSDPELVKRVFTAPPDVLHAGEGHRILEPILGPSSVLLLDEGPHVRRRRMLLPPLHGSRMERYGETMRAVAAAEIARWPRDVAAPAWPRMHSMTLEVILRTVFGMTDGERMERLRDVLGRLVGYASDGARGVLIALGAPERLDREGRFADFRDTLSEARGLVLDEVVLRRRARREQSDDVLALLLQARDETGSRIPDEEIRDNLITLLVAGNESTATALSWALERLARSPDSLDRTIAEADDGGGPYTQAVIEETLRLWPVFPLIARRVMQEFEIGDWIVPAGATIAPAILLMHRRPDIYPDPDEFRPERFLERPPGTYTWIPFGGGVRRCLGASFSMFEMRVVLSALLSQVRPVAPEGEAEGPKRRVITLAPARGASVVLVPREREG